MADIKIEHQNKKIVALNEEPPIQADRFKESLAEKAEKGKIEAIEKQTAGEKEPAEATRPATVGLAVGIMAPLSQRQKEIETVLSEGMQDIYLNLTPERRREFKRAGEETAKKINQLLVKAKINIGEIIKLIKKWLSLIPGVNKYFLEQAAKIKADELVKMKN